MNTLTVCGLVAVALLSAILIQPFVRSPSADRPEYGISLSGPGQQRTPMNSPEIIDYSLEFRAAAPAEQQ